MIISTESREEIEQRDRIDSEHILSYRVTIEDAQLSMGEVVSARRGKTYFLTLKNFWYVF